MEKIDEIISKCVYNNRYDRNKKDNWLSVNMVKHVANLLDGWVIVPLDKNSNSLLVV